MRVLAWTPDVVGRFKGKQSCGQVGLDKGDCACVFQEAYHRPVFGIRFPGVRREADGDVEAFHLHRVLERDGDACQRTLQVALIGRPFFGFGEENFGRAVGLFVRFERDFAVGAEDVDGVRDVLLDILDKVLDRLAEYAALLWGQGIAVRRGEVCNLGRALVLLALAVLCKPQSYQLCGESLSLDYLPVGLVLPVLQETHLVNLENGFEPRRIQDRKKS